MIARWSILLCVYVVWNILSYCAMNVFGWNREWYDYSYWVSERAFVITAFAVLHWYVIKQYKWVIKTFIAIAAWKMLYLVLVITGKIQKNDFHSLMGILFIVTIAAIIVKWERLSRRS
jgi:hypothetical protein